MSQLINPTKRKRKWGKGFRRFIGERRKTHRPSRGPKPLLYLTTDRGSHSDVASDLHEISLATNDDSDEMSTVSDQVKVTPCLKNRPANHTEGLPAAKQRQSSIRHNIPSPFTGFDSPEEIQELFYVLPSSRRPIRVLSMFDGIGAGLVALTKLGLSVEVYYACEVDKGAIRVVTCNFPQTVHLGNVKTLPKNYDELGRIDLLLGAPPCQDISQVNAKRRLFNDPESSAFLFFDFVKARDYFLKIAKQTHSKFFWFLESTFSMDKSTLERMNKSLGCEPVMRCASEFVPMIRRRYFWTDIPFSCERRDNFQKTKLTLQVFLKSNRWATVPFTSTLTTNSNSQRTGPLQEFPVIEDGEPSQLYISEIEILFGFIEHYTDCGHLSITARRKLLGQAWCVPVIEELLSPLSLFFKSNPSSSMKGLSAGRRLN